MFGIELEQKGIQKSLESKLKNFDEKSLWNLDRKVKIRISKREILPIEIMNLVK